MKAKRVAVVGLGSLGSHVAAELSNVCNELILVDHDVVEAKNIEKSTYRVEHIGMYCTLYIRDINYYQIHMYNFPKTQMIIFHLP